MLLLYTFRSLVLEQHQSIVQEEFPMGKPLYIALLRLLRLLGQKIVHFDKALKCKKNGFSLIPWKVFCCYDFPYLPMCFILLISIMYIVQIKSKVSAKILHTHLKNFCKDIYCQITIVVLNILKSGTHKNWWTKFYWGLHNFFFFASKGQ